jgi:signal transduction histidine kinase
MHGQTAHSLMYTTERDGKRLYLLFDGQSVLRLALYFGVFPLTIVLVLIYTTAWWVYRESNYLLSPIVWLANKFDRFDPAHADASLEDLSNIPGDVDWEVEKLVNSFSSYSRRIQRFVERERAFTRDASHEFRTPLTVIKMASDLLLAEQELDDYSKKYVTRIKGSARDMEELIDAFLILARETDKEFEDEHTIVVNVVEREIRNAEIYLEKKPVVINIDEQFPLELFTARKVIAIVLGNLIRNAVLYTNEGSVTIAIKEHSVVITDTGIGMTEDQTKKIFQPYYRAEQDGKTQRKGYGVGLTIVKRLSNRFNWIVKVESEVGKGTTIEVIFDESRLAKF